MLNSRKSLFSYGVHMHYMYFPSKATSIILEKVESLVNANKVGVAV